MRVAADKVHVCSRDSVATSKISIFRLLMVNRLPSRQIELTMGWPATAEPYLYLFQHFRRECKSFGSRWLSKSVAAAGPSLVAPGGGVWRGTSSAVFSARHDSRLLTITLPDSVAIAMAFSHRGTKVLSYCLGIGLAAIYLP